MVSVLIMRSVCVRRLFVRVISRVRMCRIFVVWGLSCMLSSVICKRFRCVRWLSSMKSVMLRVFLLRMSFLILFFCIFLIVLILYLLRFFLVRLRVNVLRRWWGFWCWFLRLRVLVRRSYLRLLRWVRRCIRRGGSVWLWSLFLLGLILLDGWLNMNVSGLVCLGVWKGELMLGIGFICFMGFWYKKVNVIYLIFNVMV